MTISYSEQKVDVPQSTTFDTLEPKTTGIENGRATPSIAL
jgi:hypothetical protein